MLISSNKESGVGLGEDGRCTYKMWKRDVEVQSKSKCLA